jgi:hypothetical protein
MPVPTPPVYTTLKALYRETPLVRDGLPAALIVAPADGRYRALAEGIAAAVARRTGVVMPVVADSDPAATLPLKTHVIVLGNRSTNALLSALYDRFYALVDLHYPGSGGHVVQTVHSPFGDGLNAVLVGGSDASGVAAAAERFAALVEGLTPSAPDALSVGWLADIRLGEGFALPEKVADARIWEESRMYGSSGYFGWNVVSKAMALYCMTGEERFAREFLRFAFPDAATIKVIEDLDGERIENKHEPLAGPYHYAAHMMVLFWDLIEESPFFAADLRLRVTNALSKQLRHRAAEHVYGATVPPPYVGDRHRDWSAVSLYVLARYFQKDYPEPVWQAGLDSCRTHFSALLKSPWLAGANDHLFWYTSYYDPILDYMVLSGDRSALEQGHLAEALRTQDVLFTGNQDDWGLKASSLNFLQRAAYVTGDGRWLFYRERTGIDTRGLRLGQSFWTEDPAPRPPAELCGQWTIQRLPEPFWQTRNSGIPLPESFLWGSYRTRLDAAGDYVLLKGHNGGGRNPHHTFALLEFRLSGNTLLKGYGTQVQTSADGMVEPVVGMDAGLAQTDALGRTAYAVGEVPRLPFCTWQRSLLLRAERFALIVDRFRYRADSANLLRRTLWETVGGRWDPGRRAVVFQARAAAVDDPGWKLFPALGSPCSSRPANADAARSLIDLPELGIRLAKATRPGDYLEQRFTLDEPFVGKAYADLLHYSDRGVVRILLNGREVVAECDHFASSVAKSRISLGDVRLEVGAQILRVEALRCREGFDRCYIGLVGVALQEHGAESPAEPYLALCPADADAGSGTGLVRCDWTGPVRSGSTQTCFTLCASTPDAARQPLSCTRIAPEAAVLRTPQPALAVAGRHEGTAAAIVLVAPDGVSGRGLATVAVAGLAVQADPSVDLDWDWGLGSLHVVCPAPSRLALTATAAHWGGHAIAPVNGLVTLDLPAGEHRLDGVRPPESVLVAVHLALTHYADSAASSAGAVPAVLVEPPAPPTLAPVFQAALGSPVVAMTVGDGHLFAACAREIVVLDPGGTALARMRSEGDIRTLHWWPEQSLLLAGCADERVVAFHLDGSVAWTFVSEMDRAVWEAAKQYWFKGAHPGVYGLDTGAFLEGGTQCFVGSACTLEILAGDGRLLKRLPVFWGPGWRFGIRPRTDGSRDLLIARQPTDSHALALVNSRALAVTGSGFDGVPDGHTNLTGWATMSRNHVVIKDIDGDGQAEVVSEINGFWNRITVWDLDGRPRCNAQIGPGRQIPYRNVRDLVVEDLDGDGRCEVVAALDSGLVTLLDCRLERRWSVRTSTPPELLLTIPRPGGGAALLAACEGSEVVQFDAAGAVTARAVVDGCPVAGCVLSASAGPLAVVGTASGQISAFGVLP